MKLTRIIKELKFKKLRFRAKGYSNNNEILAKIKKNLEMLQDNKFLIDRILMEYQSLIEKCDAAYKEYNFTASQITDGNTLLINYSAQSTMNEAFRNLGDGARPSNSIGSDNALLNGIKRKIEKIEDEMRIYAKTVSNKVYGLSKKLHKFDPAARLDYSSDISILRSIGQYLDDRIKDIDNDSLHSENLDYFIRTQPKRAFNKILPRASVAVGLALYAAVVVQFLQPVSIGNFEGKKNQYKSANKIQSVAKNKSESSKNTDWEKINNPVLLTVENEIIQSDLDDLKSSNNLSSINPDTTVINERQNYNEEYVTIEINGKYAEYAKQGIWGLGSGILVDCTSSNRKIFKELIIKYNDLKDVKSERYGIDKNLIEKGRKLLIPVRELARAGVYVSLDAEKNKKIPSNKSEYAGIEINSLSSSITGSSDLEHTINASIEDLQNNNADENSFDKKQDSRIYSTFDNDLNSFMTGQISNKEFMSRYLSQGYSEKYVGKKLYHEYFKGNGSKLEVVISKIREGTGLSDYMLRKIRVQRRIDLMRGASLKRKEKMLAVSM